jgi:hypothetical protein
MVNKPNAQLPLLGCESDNLPAENFFSDRRWVRYEDRYILIEWGCRREIPDTETAQFMGISASECSSIALSELEDIPTCHSPFFPTRRNGQVRPHFWRLWTIMP